MRTQTNPSARIAGSNTQKPPLKTASSGFKNRVSGKTDILVLPTNTEKASWLLKPFDLAIRRSDSSMRRIDIDINARKAFYKIDKMLLSPLAAPSVGILDMDHAAEGENCTEDGNEIDLEDTTHKLERNEVFEGFISQVKSCRENGHKHIDSHVKPQLLDQMDGINGMKNRVFEQLCSIAETIKGSSEVDLSLFSEGNIGSEAATAKATFNPALATLEPSWLRANFS